jgi:hypothetical protein
MRSGAVASQERRFAPSVRASSWLARHARSRRSQQFFVCLAPCPKFNEAGSKNEQARDSRTKLKKRPQLGS